MREPTFNSVPRRWPRKDTDSRLILWQPDDRIITQKEAQEVLNWIATLGYDMSSGTAIRRSDP